jgi:hypothetical protein
MGSHAVRRTDRLREWSQRWRGPLGAAAGVAVVVGASFGVRAGLLYLTNPAQAQTTLCTGCNFGPVLGSQPLSFPTQSSSPVVKKKPLHRPTVIAPAPALTQPVPVRTSPVISVSFAHVGQLAGGFEGRITIVNNGTGNVSNWQLVAALPGDLISSIQNAQGPDAQGVLYVQPLDTQGTIPPGGSLSVYFNAIGPTTSLAACTFNGATCQ